MILKEVKETVLQNAGSLLEPDRTGRGYICPICGNGSGHSGDGIAPIPNTDGLFKCFVCGHSGDLISFIAKSENRSYMETAKTLAIQFGIEHHFGSDFQPIQKKTAPIKEEHVDEPKKDYTDYFNYVHTLIHKKNNHYFSLRGLNHSTVTHFNLGFDPTWQHPKLVEKGKAPMSPRAIIPITKFSYLARDVRYPLTDKQKKYAKQKVGAGSIFNPDALKEPFPFIVEGEFDAMSFFEIGFPALALGSISYSNKLFAYLEENHISPKRLLVALDNDERGRDAATVLVQQLAEKGYHVHLCDSSVLYDNHKDANELLVDNRQLFFENVTKTLDFAKSFSDEVISTDSTIDLLKKTPSTSESVSTAPSEQLRVEQTSQTLATDTVSFHNDSVPSALQTAISTLQSVADFSQQNIFSDKILHAAAICQLDSPIHFLTFRDKCKQNKLSVTALDSAVKRVMKAVIKFRNRQQLGDLRGLLHNVRNPQALEYEEARQATIDKLSTLDYSTLADDEDARQNIISLIRENLLQYTRSGKVEATVKNIEAILKYDPVVRDCIGWDLFQHKFVAKCDLPWYPGTKTKGKNWEDNDDIGFENYVDRNYNGFRNSRLIFAALNEWAYQHPTHPIREYLQSLTWDGTPRLATFFVDTLGVEDTDYVRDVTACWFNAAVARPFNPGCKWDFCLVLKGNQGIGKSTVLSSLAGQWFNDSIFSVKGKDAMENLIGSWIVELDEMEALSKASNESIKAYISRQTDRFRLPYGRRKEEFARQCVFAATTNSVTFLRDKTGGRRFLILVSDADKTTTSERLRILTDEYVDQVWAEAFHYYKEMFRDGFDSKKLLPAEDILDIAEEFQKFSTEGSELEGMIDAYLHIPILEKDKWRKMTKDARKKFVSENVPVDEEDRTVLVNMETGEVVGEGGEAVDLVERDCVSAVEIAYELFGVDNPMRDRNLIKEITEIMARMDGWKQVTWKRCGVYGQQRIAFERC